MGKRKTGRSKKHAKAKCDTEPEELTKAPHSFVISRKRLGKNVNDLMLNFRRMMEPYTASHLKAQKNNVIKDFVHMAGPLNVTHLILFTKSERGIYLRIAKLPRGPTLTYQIKEYSLVRDVISSQKKSFMYEKLFEHHPLLVLNNFSGEGMQFKLMTTMFQNMFPSINVNKTNLNVIRRSVLLNYNEDKTIDLRQYAIKIVPTGISKAVKKLIQSKVPDLSQFQNVGEYLQKSGNLSESEVEMDTAANTVILPQPISSRGNISSEKSAIRLYEIGPRMKLQLIKIDEGLLSGDILFHEFVKKTPEEIAELKERIKQKKVLKQQRREQQRKNVERKKLAANKESASKDSADDEEEEDLKWYRKEVGKDPDEDMSLTKKRKSANAKFKSVKKLKKADGTPKALKNEKSSAPLEKKTSFQEFLARKKKRKQTKKKKLQSHKSSKKKSTYNKQKKQKKKM